MAAPVDTVRELKDIACQSIDSSSSELNEISQNIWKNPELAFKEVYAHKLLTDFFASRQFAVTPHYLLDTAFKATFHASDKGPNVAVLCEYDALPVMGHGCGHNLIAEVGVATALGIQAAMQKAEYPLGNLTVIGTPAEEGLCGKADLIRLGAFKGLDVAMMAHPSQSTLTKPRYMSMCPVRIQYHGKASHASSHPWDGLNALDAAVMCYNNTSCLRQQMKPTWRLHGVIKKGGEQPNIIPDETELEYYLRAPTDSEIQILKEKVTGCIQAAAIATGCTVNFQFAEKCYSNLLSNSTMAGLFRENAESIGVQFETNEEKIRKFGGSTDMGNVSHVVPSIHPKFHIGTQCSNHSKEFTVAAGDQKAQSYTLNVAKSLAMVAIDVLTNPDQLAQVKQDFEEDLKNEASI